MDWIELAQDMHRWQAAVNMAMNHQVPESVENLSISCGRLGFSRQTVLYGVGILLNLSFIILLLNATYLVRHC